MPIIAPISRDERHLMQKAIHKTHDKNYARRLTAMLMLHWGNRINDVAITLCCTRSSVGRWINWLLKSFPAGRAHRWPKETPKFRVIYQPVYSPWVNHVERLWQTLHGTIMCNHQCRSRWQRVKKVRYFMETVSP